MHIDLFWCYYVRHTIDVNWIELTTGKISLTDRFTFFHSKPFFPCTWCRACWWHEAFFNSSNWSSRSCRKRHHEEKFDSHRSIVNFFYYSRGAFTRSFHAIILLYEGIIVCDDNIRVELSTRPHWESLIWRGFFEASTNFNGTSFEWDEFSLRLSCSLL